MDPPLSSDDSTDALFEKVAVNLERLFAYTPAQSDASVREYFRLFQDEQYCRSLKIGVQDEEFFHHEGAGYMAMRVHYHLTLKADPDPNRLLDWMNAYVRLVGDREARRVFIGSLNSY